MQGWHVQEAGRDQRRQAGPTLRSSQALFRRQDLTHSTQQKPGMGRQKDSLLNKIHLRSQSIFMYLVSGSSTSSTRWARQGVGLRLTDKEPEAL